MKRSMTFLIFHIFSLHAVNNVGLESTNVVKKRTLNRLAYEMDIIKKFPSAVGRCLKNRTTCSPEDKQKIEQGIKRILFVITLLSVIGIPTVYAFHKKLNKINPQTIGAFSEAVRQSDFNKLKELFSQYTLSQGSLNDLLEEAVAFANAKTVAAIIDRIKNPSFTTKDGDPIFKVIISKRPGVSAPESVNEVNKIVALLCESGANPNARYKNDGWTPLMHAAYYDLPHVIRMLLRHGADKKLRNDQGKTAYDLAVENKVSDTVKRLVAF